MLGGAWVPTFLFPAWLQQLTVIVPTRWAMDGLEAMTWRGLPASAAVTPTLVLLGFATLFAALAVRKFPWEEALTSRLRRHGPCRPCPGSVIVPRDAAGSAPAPYVTRLAA